MSKTVVSYFIKFMSVWVLLLLVPITANAESNNADEKIRQIEDFLKDRFAKDEPGTAIIVMQNDTVLYRRAHGLADMEHKIPLKPEMVFRIASLTKQFTAASIMLLVEEGKLNLSDPVVKHLPDYPIKDAGITIYHLLTHTSGIKNVTSIEGFQDILRKDTTPRELAELFLGAPVDFKPGENKRYSNSGYVLLGAIIEKISGQSYGDFIKERIFDPLGMQNSYLGDHKRIIPGRVKGYNYAETLENSDFISMSIPNAAGAILSTVDDLSKWHSALRHNQLLSAKSYAAMTEPVTLNDGSRRSYGFGLGIHELRGKPIIWHEGGIQGFAAYMHWQKEEGFFVAILANSHKHNLDFIASSLAAIALGDPFSQRTAIELTPEQLAAVVGVYRFPGDFTRTITMESGKLFCQRQGGRKLPIVPFASNKFFYVDSPVFIEFPLGRKEMAFYYDDRSTPQVGAIAEE